MQNAEFQSGSDPQPDASAAHLVASDTALAIALGRLVDEAAEGSVESVERILLQTLVDLGLTPSAGIWRRCGPSSEWARVRSFGGCTPPPPEGFSSPACRSFELSDETRVVTSRREFCPEGRSEQLEETIEVLVTLTATLTAGLEPFDTRAAPPLPRAERRR